jgi:hypothetical protein
MKIKYTGPGGKASITFNGALYRFTPECDVDDPEAVEHLLADDSYIQAGDNQPDDMDIPPGTEELPTEQAKPFQCEVCGRGFDRAIALAGHKRSHKA